MYCFIRDFFPCLLTFLVTANFMKKLLQIFLESNCEPQIKLNFRWEREVPNNQGKQHLWDDYFKRPLVYQVLLSCWFIRKTRDGIWVLNKQAAFLRSFSDVKITRSMDKPITRWCSKLSSNSERNRTIHFV